ncbi:MAG: hypothetical protein ACREBD_30350 [Blastocatellia bacterium]
MKRKISEFSYGFVLTHELVNTYSYLLTAAPVFPSLVQEGRAGGGYDVNVPIRGYPLFLQFKASEYMKRRNAKESKLVGLPYFRFALHRKTQSNQHQLLIELEKKGNAVFYASPKMHEAVNLNGAFFDKEVVARSLFVSPTEIGELSDNDIHRIVFSSESSDAYFCSAPRKLKLVVQGEYFSETLHRISFQGEAQVLDDEFFHRLAGEMVSLAAPNRRIFDELSRGKVEMSAATFANYLAKTLFDCELLIIPA